MDSTGERDRSWVSVRLRTRLEDMLYMRRRKHTSIPYEDFGVSRWYEKKYCNA
jgi:hypothetical protein